MTPGYMLDTDTCVYIALSVGLILVTNNTREFSRIEGLALENWT